MVTQQAFVRSEGPEEITPPVPAKQRSFDGLQPVKTHSFESLSAAEVLLQSQRGGTARWAEEAAQDGGLSPGSEHAAALLRGVRGGARDQDTAVDCLMSLSSTASAAQGTKRRAAAAPAPRRKLQIRPSPLGSPNEPAATASAALDSTGPPPAETFNLLSTADAAQLRTLAAAYKLCPSPTASQLGAIAHHVGLPADRLLQWFESRQARAPSPPLRLATPPRPPHRLLSTRWMCGAQVLQTWVASQPALDADELRGLFYANNESASLS